MLKLLFALLPLFSLLRLTTGDEGGSGDDQKPPKIKPSELLSQFNGDAVRMAEKLADVMNDNADVRDKNRTLRADNTALKAKVPADGSVILTPEQAQQWQQYAALGAPDDLQTQVEAGKAAQDKVAAYERAETLGRVAQAAGFQNNSVFRLLATPVVDQLSTRDVVDATGKTVKQAIITVDGVVKTLAEYANEQDDWRDALPSLQAQVHPPAPRVPGQSSVSSMAAGDLTQQFIEQRNQQAQARPNPLMPAAKGS